MCCVAGTLRKTLGYLPRLHIVGTERLGNACVGRERAVHVYVRFECALKRDPEEAFVDLAMEGYFGAAPEAGTDTFLHRALGIAMGGKGASGSCSAVFERLSASR